MHMDLKGGKLKLEYRSLKENNGRMVVAEVGQWWREGKQWSNDKIMWKLKGIFNYKKIYFIFIKKIG